MQVKALEDALMAQANKAYKQWQKDMYHRCQSLSAQEGALTHLIRQSIKAAHFCELTHSWYAHLQRHLVNVRNHP